MRCLKQSGPSLTSVLLLLEFWKVVRQEYIICCYILCVYNVVYFKSIIRDKLDKTFTWVNTSRFLIINLLQSCTTRRYNIGLVVLRYLLLNFVINVVMLVVILDFLGFRTLVLPVDLQLRNLARSKQVFTTCSTNTNIGKNL